MTIKQVFGLSELQLHTEAKKTHIVELTSWQIAQLERLVEDQINQLKRDGLGTHALTSSYEELLKRLSERITALEYGNKQHEVMVGVMASLAAAISLLERGGKKAAASDKMFEQMLVDYRTSLEKARTLFE